MALSVETRKFRGSASRLDVAKHVYNEMAASIERRKQNPEYEGSPQYERDKSWLAVLFERAQMTEQEVKNLNPLKLSKRRK